VTITSPSVPIQPRADSPQLPHSHPNIDLGFVRAQKHSRNKRSAPGEGRDAQRKKAKLAVGADAGESSTGTPGVESDAVDAVDDVVVEAADVTMTTE
jgi:hypothetical protein